MDMTKEMLTHFNAFAPTDSALYHVGGDGSLETLYLSDNVPALLDLTRGEYLKITQRDAMDLTLPADRPGLQQATASCLRACVPRSSCSMATKASSKSLSCSLATRVACNCLKTSSC